MRTLFALAAMAAMATGCAPDSDKTNPAVATEETAAERAAAAPAAGASSFTEGQARDRATQAGYMDIGPLTQNAAGAWQGSAMKGGASVTVIVDYQGNVTEQGAATPSAADTGTMTPTTPDTTPAPTTPSTDPATQH